MMRLQPKALGFGGAFAVLVLALPAYGDTSIWFTTPSDGTPPKKPAEKAVELIARLSKKTFKQGEPVDLHLEIRNNTSAPVTIWSREAGANTTIVVKNERNTEAELTDKGRSRRTRFEYSFSTFNHPLALEGGKSHEYGIDPLHQLYELPPGSYTVEVTYYDKATSKPPFNRALKLKSKPVSFTVTP